MHRRNQQNYRERRHFLGWGVAGIGAALLARVQGVAETVIPDSVLAKNASFAGDKGPQLEAALVQEFVRLSHFDYESVTAMVRKFPRLVYASWDWGGGDIETGLGAASHVGNRDIALLLLENGARPDIFSAAMLGQLEVVRGFLSADPTLIECEGPHGLSLMHHAKKGGDGSLAVVEYLEELG